MGGRGLTFEVRLDLIVERDGERFIAEVKTGDLAADRVPADVDSSGVRGAPPGSPRPVGLWSGEVLEVDFGVWVDADRTGGGAAGGARRRGARTDAPRRRPDPDGQTAGRPRSPSGAAHAPSAAIVVACMAQTPPRRRGGAHDGPPIDDGRPPRRVLTVGALRPLRRPGGGAPRCPHHPRPHRPAQPHRRGRLHEARVRAGGISAIDAIVQPTASAGPGRGASRRPTSCPGRASSSVARRPC